MVMNTHSARDYVMGHTDRERRRLMLQGSVLNPITQDLLRRAELAAGMTVLDLGCGAGDVTLMVARMVGPSGRVVAVDMDEAALKIARSRADGAGLSNVEFHQGRIGELQGLGAVDAVTGRHILIHMPHPEETVAQIFGLLAAGGVAVFQEYDFSSHSPPLPASPMYKRLLELFCTVFEAAGTHPAMGAQLYRIMSRSGFVGLNARVEYPIDGGSDSPYYEWVVESLRTVLPRAVALGLVTEAEMDIETYEQRLREEVIRGQSGMASPVMFGVIGRKPA